MRYFMKTANTVSGYHKLTHIHNNILSAYAIGAVVFTKIIDNLPIFRLIYDCLTRCPVRSGCGLVVKRTARNLG